MEKTIHFKFNKKMNRGTGAGGSQTNASGLPFEKKVAITRTYEGKIILRKAPFKKYMKTKHSLEIEREPDEAVIDEAKKTIHIIEIKNQNCEGSVETKLWSGPGFVHEYEFCLPGWKIYYSFCISSFLEKRYISEKLKYKALRTFNEKNNIKVFFGDSSDYIIKRDEWINL
jgi:hypothetical protein